MTVLSPPSPPTSLSLPCGAGAGGHSLGPGEPPARYGGGDGGEEEARVGGREHREDGGYTHSIYGPQTR